MAVSKKGNLAVAQSLADLLRQMWSEQTQFIRPVLFRQAMANNVNSVYSSNREQDAHEFLARLLDAVHEALNRKGQTKPQPSVVRQDSDLDLRSDQDIVKEAWASFTARNDSQIIELFYGLLRSRVVCQECAYASTRFEPFSVLTVPLGMQQCRIFINLIGAFFCAVLFADFRPPYEASYPLNIGDPVSHLAELVKADLLKHDLICASEPSSCDSLLFAQLTDSKIKARFLITIIAGSPIVLRSIMGVSETDSENSGGVRKPLSALGVNLCVIPHGLYFTKRDGDESAV
ncbi:ubiquitin carboxyl-terminal hydrolase [Cichlidogyrus casuarinus]|uniref:ubiquitinyl hydrolase 1 n=1 Tax=Cichlidogyrus casuarinus TaxID=1844966 RepID=A0ABD2Q2X4_9PLAT